MTNEGLNGRVDKMAAWAGDVNVKLAEIETSLNGFAQRATSPLVEQINELWTAYDNIPTRIKEKQFELIELEMAVKSIKEEVEEIEDDAALDVSMMVDDNGKFVYSNQKVRDMAAQKNLRKNNQYQEAKQRHDDAVRLVRQCRAEIEHLEGKSTEFRYRNRALIAQLENVTAMITGGK